MDYSFRLTAMVLLYAPSHRQDSTYHGLCYTSRGALAGMRNSSMGPPHEGSIQWPIASWANALTTELHLAPVYHLRVSTTGLCCTRESGCSCKSISTTGNIELITVWQITLLVLFLVWLVPGANLLAYWAGALKNKIKNNNK